MKYLRVLLITLSCLFGVSTFAQTQKSEPQKDFIPVFDSVYNGISNHYVWNGDLTFSFSDGIMAVTLIKIREVNGDTLVKGEPKVVMIPMTNKTAQGIIKNTFSKETIEAVVWESKEFIKRSSTEFKPKK